MHTWYLQECSSKTGYSYRKHWGAENSIILLLRSILEQMPKLLNTTVHESKFDNQGSNIVTANNQSRSITVRDLMCSHPSHLGGKSTCKSDNQLDTIYRSLDWLVRLITNLRALGITTGCYYTAWVTLQRRSRLTMIIIIKNIWSHSDYCLIIQLYERKLIIVWSYNCRIAGQPLKGSYIVLFRVHICSYTNNYKNVDVYRWNLNLSNITI